MIIGTCGFGSTGSSAVSDYLSEYDDVQVLDALEFSWVSDTDGLIDLERAVMNPHNRTSDSIKAIQRFLDKAKKGEGYFESIGIPANVFRDSYTKFIESITTVDWYWYDYDKTYRNKIHRYFERDFMLRIVIPHLERKKNKQVNIYPLKKVRFSAMPENYNEAARQHIREMLSALGADFSRKIVLDQPFCGNNPRACFPYYDDPYAIVVDRDPRDNYVFARTKLLGRNHFMAVEPVENFVKYYRALRQNQPYQKPSDRVLYLHFEDMVYDYDNTTRKIQTFLGIGDNPKPKSVFDPSLSIANTQVFKRFPQFESDIKIIEEELTEYLFDFEKYGDVEIKGEMFFGKSPLHK